MMMKKAHKTLLGACLLASASAANATLYQLGFALDASGSVGSSDFNLEKGGLANAIDNIFTDSFLASSTDTYEISVISFASSTSTAVDAVVLDSTSNDTVVAAVNAMSYTNGNTAMSSAINSLVSLLSASSNFANPDATQILNIATDGVPNSSSATTTAASNAQTAGMDMLSFEAIGSSTNISFMESIAFPTPVSSTPNPTNGFVTAVATFADFENAITQKIQAVTNINPIPAPASLALLGIGFISLVTGRRKSK